MADSDWVIKQGDVFPVFSDTLTLSDGTVPNISTLQFVMRNAQMQPVTLTGTPAVVNPTTGAVQYAPTVGDTTASGSYLASWVAELVGGGQMTFPTVGYLSVEIEPSLSGTSIPQLLVDLETVKRYPGMSIPANDRHVDTRLTDFILAVQPLIEHVTGPILPTIFEEWHDGGQDYLQLRHPPSVGYGTTPVLDLIACSEYNGPIEWSLAGVASPDQGQMYSYQLDTRLGRVVRRTAGGGVQPFPYMPQSIHVVYRAGQSEVPRNVRLAVCESVRLYWQTVQPVGTGRKTQSDQMDLGPTTISVLPPSVERLLKPTRRHPSIA